MRPSKKKQVVKGLFVKAFTFNKYGSANAKKCADIADITVSDGGPKHVPFATTNDVLSLGGA